MLAAATPSTDSAMRSLHLPIQQCVLPPCRHQNLLPPPPPNLRSAAAVDSVALVDLRPFQKAANPVETPLRAGIVSEKQGRKVCFKYSLGVWWWNCRHCLLRVVSGGLLVCHFPLTQLEKCVVGVVDSRLRMSAD